jgi:hypothetical protein
MSARVLSICVCSESAARISSSKFLGSEQASKKVNPIMHDQTSICFAKRMAVKLEEAVVRRSGELSKNQKRFDCPRLRSDTGWIGRHDDRSMVE